MKDTNDFLCKLKNVRKLPEDAIMVTIDVVFSRLLLSFLRVFGPARSDLWPCIRPCSKPLLKTERKEKKKDKTEKTEKKGKNMKK